ncbi:D-alanyl-D-alanine carboxypeptidase family protein [Streptomyces boninensis]|uniref:D-alanyl-D-alanine carboxypeptidase family protein n=1 Tax=Streptomyces boninensis TaxID=2039455 RepID=UPI003B22388C
MRSTGKRARSRTRGRRVTAASLAAGAVVAGYVTTSSAEAAPEAPTVAAKGAYLMDTGSGAKVFGKADSTRRQMASTTKVMTTAVVLDTPGLDLDRKVKIKQAYRDYVTREGASTANLRTGDTVTVRQLLYATLLPSGCDAAMALADTYGSGSTVSARTKSFISKMNKKAAELGMTNTKFDSFDGISVAGDHYTTPKDLTKVARHALADATFMKVVKTTTTKRNALKPDGTWRVYTWHNTNQLLGSYNGAIGIKTGTGTAAGRCLVFAAKRGERTLAGVILNDEARYTDAAKLLDYGFGSDSAETMKLRKLPEGAQRD